MRTDVTFQSDRFNTTEVRPYFINDCCFGDDCAQWLAAQLRATGVGEVAEPWQEDWGWQLAVSTSEVRCLVSVGLVPEAPPEWQILVDAKRPLLARLLGGQNDEPLRRLVGAIHESLSTAPEIREVRWRTRTETDRGIGAGSTEPFG